MASRLKQDEKNEKIIRGLLKLPANKKCINCNSLGPQYVCTNFWTFICTNCSGIHREFTHRVKSVSMAKFSSQEVTALQEGGNERAKEVLFKEWDLQRHSFPDSSNVERLRTFIKHVYVDQRYTGDKSIDRPPRMKGDREDGYEHRKPETLRGGAQSPSYDEAYDRRYGERPSPGGSSDDRNSRYSYEERRSPGYDQGDYRRSPGLVEDRRRDDKFGKSNQNLRFEDRRISDGASKTEGKSPNHQREIDVSSPPVVRPVREILGEDAPPLRIGEPPKPNGGRVVEGPVQRTASSNSIVATDGHPAEAKSVNTVSLIDFDADPEPPVAAAQGQSIPQQTAAPPVDSGNWASFDFGPEQKTATATATATATNANTLESSLAQLYVSGNMQPVSNISTLPTVAANSFPKSAGSWPSGQQNEPFLPSAAIGQTQTMVPQSTSHAVGIGQTMVPQSTSHAVGVGQTTVPQSIFPQSTSHAVGPSNQSWTSSVAPSVGGPTATGHVSQFSSAPVAGAISGVPFHSQTVEAKPRERTELPADLFTFTYPMGATAYPGWQARPQYGMGFGMQYPTTAMQPAAAGPPPFSHPSRSANPFDVSGETTLAHASTMPSLPGALSNTVDPSGMLRSSSLGASPSPQWTSQQPLSNSLAPMPGGYMPQVQGNMNQQTSANLFSMGNLGVGDVGNNKVAYGVPGMDPRLNAQYSQPSTSNSFPSGGGNPFG